MQFTGLKDGVAIITGAASGMGQGQAVYLAREGVKIIGLDINEAGLEETRKKVENEAGQIEVFKVDVTDSAKLQEIVQYVIDQYDRIDILCNTAGIFDKHQKTLEIDEAFFKRIFEVNVFPIFALCRMVLPQMLKQKKGVILNMASLAGKSGNAGGSAYTASKHAIYGYTKELCVEYSGQGIRANAICPGSIWTPFIDDGLDVDGSRRLNYIPCGRLGTVDDIASLTVFLASDQASFIQGAGISIDGGRHAKG